MMSENRDKASINDSWPLLFHFLPKPPWWTFLDTFFSLETSTFTEGDKWHGLFLSTDANSFADF
jgi:hypothetical protein